MKFEIKIQPLRRLAQSVCSAALDTASLLQECSAAAARRAGGAASRLCLERKIHDLRSEIGLQMQAVGEIMYASHRGSPADSGRVQEILEYVDGLQEKLDAHRRELETLQGLLICPACGEANHSNCLYCQNCGKPLSRQ